MDLLQIALPLLSPVLSGIVLYKWQTSAKKNEQRAAAKRLDEEEFKKSHFAIVKGVEALLRDRLLDSMEQCLSVGYVSIAQLEVLTSMYEAYKALGGNGIVHRMFDQLSELPHNPPEQQESGNPV